MKGIQLFPVLGNGSNLGSGEAMFCATFSRSVSNYNRLFTRALLGNKTGQLFTMYKNLRPTESRMIPRRFEEKFFALRIALPVGSSVDELHNEPKSLSN